MKNLQYMQSMFHLSSYDLPLCHRCVKAYSPFRNRRKSEGRTKAERRMNEQRSKDDRTPIEEMPYLHKSHYKDTKFL